MSLRKREARGQQLQAEKASFAEVPEVYASGDGRASRTWLPP